MRIAKRIANKMHREGIINELSDVEIYRYGIDNGLNILINLVISLCMAIALGQQIILLVFLASYIPLRSYSGGWHFSSRKVCCIASNAVIGGILFMNSTLSKNLVAMCIVMVWAVFYLWHSKQKGSSKRRLNNVEQDIFNNKKKQYIIIIVIGVIFLILFSMRQCATVVITATTLTAVLVFLQRRYDNYVNHFKIT